MEAETIKVKTLKEEILQLLNDFTDDTGKIITEIELVRFSNEECGVSNMYMDIELRLKE